jgi:CRP-like cAMP-binding protein
VPATILFARDDSAQGNGHSTTAQLSSLSDVGYFTTSRILSKWEHDGMLSKKRGRVTLLAPESLMAA